MAVSNDAAVESQLMTDVEADAMLCDIPIGLLYVGEQFENLIPNYPQLFYPDQAKHFYPYFNPRFSFPGNIARVSLILIIGQKSDMFSVIYYYR